MKATATVEVELEDDEAFSEDDVREGIDDYIDIANEYCGNIKLHLKGVNNITIKEE